MTTVTTVAFATSSFESSREPLRTHAAHTKLVNRSTRDARWNAPAPAHRRWYGAAHASHRALDACTPALCDSGASPHAAHGSTKMSSGCSFSYGNKKRSYKSRSLFPMSVYVWCR